ncbi:hypothetical protein [Granulicella sp. dw_53]|uniref:hypothetical protein n=1 Tax=Granulicella sp. dw_53 TaxID=2719792 RepID=UPI001BD5FA5D|nr:hypothetical protein [Granulicella sp. dw_53]
MGDEIQDLSITRDNKTGITTCMDIPHEHPLNANDPNRGLNVKVFLVVVAAAALVIAVVLFVVAHSHGSKTVPAPTQTSQPSSRLHVPGIRRPKPSPLHPGVLQASNRPYSQR